MEALGKHGAYQPAFANVRGRTAKARELAFTNARQYRADREEAAAICRYMV
ncbi:MAG: hypothetical protein AAF411_01000 [Myxococcota bacterium]